MSSSPERLRLLVRGAVQGVGFRPFVYRLAKGLDLGGWVENSGQGVTIEVEGGRERLQDFERRMRAEAPPRCAILGVDAVAVERRHEGAFEIRTSRTTDAPRAVVLPDVATCEECLREVFDPADRRHRYPFTNCTNCGPRYSIVAALPYDRERTTMARFAMCAACRREYADPDDRRFHAEPNACPSCGPRLTLVEPSGRSLAGGDEALLRAAEALRQGRILAIKGLGGFHLMVDARDEAAVRRLRRRKRREAKPLAVMVASLAEARRHAILGSIEASLLASAEAPIVLAPRRSETIAPSVAPDNPDLGLLLAYTPLHHLLMRELGFPVVATSGNVSEEPLCTEPDEARARLAGIADLFLVHDRPIARPVDDSVVAVVAGREQVLRRARGYAPFPLSRSSPLPALLAVGAHLKNTVAISVGPSVVMSPHVGDLETEAACAAFAKTAELLVRLYGVTPEAVACDAHPDYHSSRFAREAGRTVVAVQHHHAHVLSCMADNDLEPPVVGFAWDGTGLGTDGTIWGGESLRVSAEGFARVAWLRPFPLPGGDQAVRQPRRSALGVLHALDAALAERSPLFAPGERAVLLSMIRSGLNTPLTSSAGRLFDAVAALVGFSGPARFEGEAAMGLEFAMRGLAGDARYDFELTPAAGGGTPAWILDWRPMLRQVIADVARGLGRGEVALRFHNTLAEMIVAVALRCGLPAVALSGGCFQNRALTERAVRRLREEGFRPYWHRRVPPGDGGIAVGQILAAARAVERSRGHVPCGSGPPRRHERR
jgi:hydrogenase maturation protein HypF